MSLVVRNIKRANATVIDELAGYGAATVLDIYKMLGRLTESLRPLKEAP